MPYSVLFLDLRCPWVRFEIDLIAARLFGKMSNVEDRQEKWGKGGGGLGGGGGRKKGGEG